MNAGGRVVGETLIFPPEPLAVRLSAIALTALFGVTMVGGFALITAVLLFGMFQALRKGARGEALFALLLTAFTAWLDYWMIRIGWSGRADCFPCELVVDRQRKTILWVYRGGVMRQETFPGADRLICEYRTGARGASFYRIVAMAGSHMMQLYTVSPWTEDVVRAVQEKSIAIAQFLDLPLTFVCQGQDEFLEEPGASYNREMANREMAYQRMIMEKETGVDADAVKIECPRCNAQVTVAAVLRGASKYWSTVNAALHCRFPCCGAVHEASIVSGKISMGYLYAAGSAHFCGMVDYEVPGLQVCRRCNEGLEVSYEGERYWVEGVDQ